MRRARPSRRRAARRSAGWRGRSARRARRGSRRRRGRGRANESSATRHISSARSPISVSTSTSAGSGSTSATSFESFATVTQPSALRSSSRLMCRIASSSRRSRATGVWSASSDWIEPSIVEEQRVDLVVEGDHLVGELDVPLLERPDAPRESAETTRWPSSWSCASIRSSASSIATATRYTRAQRGAFRVRHHFVTTPQQARIPPRRGRGRTLPANPKEESKPCRSPAISFARITLAVAAAALAVARGRPPPARRRQAARARRSRAPAARSSQPLVSQWITPLGSAYGYELQYSAIGSGGGVARDHGAHRRLRRERRAADARPVHGLQRLPPDPVGARRHLGHLQPPRREEPPAHGRSDAREDLHGPDHDLGRPGDQEAQHRRQPAEHEDRDRPPLGQLGHDLQLHRLPLERQPGVEVADRQRRRRQLAGRLGRPRQLRRRSDSSRRRPARSATPTSPTPSHNHLSYFAMKNRSGKYATPGLRGIARSRHERPEARREQRALDRQPAEEVPARLPDLDLHLRDRPAAVGQGAPT